MGKSMSNKSKGRILAVDDDHGILDNFRMALEMQGYTVVCVDNPRDACMKVASQAFDLCLLDRNLGHESGVVLIPKLLEYSSQLRIVMITADSDVHGAMQALEAQGFLAVAIRPPTVPEGPTAPRAHYKRPLGGCPRAPPSAGPTIFSMLG